MAKKKTKTQFPSQGDDIICDAPASKPGPKHHPCCPYYAPTAPEPKP
jgi:hypothetical protein